MGLHGRRTRQSKQTLKNSSRRNESYRSGTAFTTPRSIWIGAWRMPQGTAMCNILYITLQPCIYQNEKTNPAILYLSFTNLYRRLSLERSQEFRGGLELQLRQVIFQGGRPFGLQPERNVVNSFPDAQDVPSDYLGSILVTDTLPQQL